MGQLLLLFPLPLYCLKAFGVLIWVLSITEAIKEKVQ